MERSEVESRYKWKTEDIFPSDEAWEESFSAAEKLLDFSSFKGTLRSAENVYRFFKRQENVGSKLERLYLYAHMRHDEGRKLWTTLWHWARSLDLRQAILTTRLAGSNMARAKKWQRFLDIWMLFRLERDGNTRRWHARFMTDRCTAAEFWMTRDR